MFPPSTISTPPASGQRFQADWNYLLDSLHDEKCILCIGPGVFSENDPNRQDRQLAAFLKKQEERLRIRVYDDGWFHYLPNANQVDAWQQVKVFYSRPQPAAEALLKKIACIPFHFILNFIPDYKLRDAFHNQQLPFDFQSYIKKQAADPKTQRPTRSKPIVYNMLGEISKRNSLVMTYTDFYTYLESVFEKNSMADVLKAEIFEADYFIFLGMPFDKWYFHLFMRILKQHSEKRSSKKYAVDPFFDDKIATICDEQYTMTFVPDGIHVFVDTLYQHCEEKNLLRTTGDGTAVRIPYTLIQSLIGANEFDKIFDILLDKVSHLGEAAKNWMANIVQVQGSWEVLKRKMRLGLLMQDAEEVQMNQMRDRIIQLTSDLNIEFPNPDIP